MRNLSVMLFAAVALATALGARTMPLNADGTPVSPSAAAWEIDPGHSSIVWSVGHNNGAGRVYGRFNTFSGTIIADPLHPELSSVEVTVDAATIDSAIVRRDDHLRNAEFFNATAFPTLTFMSTAVSAVPDQPNTYSVTGDLTMLGVSKPLTITITQLGSATGRAGELITGFESYFTVKRSEWGLAYGIPGISDEVRVMLAFECKGPAPTAPATAPTT